MSNARPVGHRTVASLVTPISVALSHLGCHSYIGQSFPTWSARETEATEGKKRGRRKTKKYLLLRIAREALTDRRLDLFCIYRIALRARGLESRNSIEAFRDQSHPRSMNIRSADVIFYCRPHSGTGNVQYIIKSGCPWDFTFSACHRTKGIVKMRQPFGFLRFASGA